MLNIGTLAESENGKNRENGEYRCERGAIATESPADNS